ncbi:MAG: ceramide glucosyltransferase [Paracoccus sp. (in: a-proteobacteria)]|nr:ceramide glucosyltransferase [Paracoccus sp. (in: a-proteobacteria)]
MIVGIVLVAHLVNVVMVAHRYGRPVARVAPQDMPPVTLLRPVCGLENGLDQTLGSGFRQDTPDFQLIHCVDDPGDPAIPVLRRLMAAYPQVAAHLLIGRDTISGNPKLNNMVKGWAAARGDWVVMADSNLDLPPDYLRQVLACRAPGIGLVTSCGTGLGPQNLWARVEAGFLNGFQTRWMLAADDLGIGYAQGKTLALPRDWLNERGGLIALAAEKAEDIAATALVRRDGLSVRMVPRPFAQPLGIRPAGAVWKRQARWAQLRRDGVTAVYAAEPLVSPVVLSVLLALSWPAAILPFLLIWYGGEWVLARRAGWPHGVADVPAWAIRDLMQPALWLAGWRSAPISWRGNAVTATAGQG